MAQILLSWWVSQQEIFVVGACLYMHTCVPVCSHKTKEGFKGRVLRNMYSCFYITKTKIYNCCKLDNRKKWALLWEGHHRSLLQAASCTKPKLPHSCLCEPEGSQQTLPLRALAQVPDSMTTLQWFWPLLKNKQLCPGSFLHVVRSFHML